MQSIKRGFMAGAVIALFLAGIGVLSKAQSVAQTPTPPSWQIVKTVTLLNQTNPIVNPQTLFTPKEDGLFRVSYYLEPIATTAQENNGVGGDYICPSVFYVDDSGLQQDRSVSQVTGNVCAQGGILNGTTLLLTGISDVFTFKAKAGNAITLNVVNQNGPGLSTTYNVLVTIEGFKGHN
ncbi:MAG TPA: hypothetical protein VGW33_07095 [Terriglobia bacterium]|nr:hypothetical protein [Terriglobia bacterium]